MLYGSVRFVANGWVDDFFVEPRFHFKYWGFEWVQAWPATGMYLHFAALAVLALLIALGLFYRTAIVLFFLGFTYVELIDVTTYLNHYYLVSLLSLLLVFLPANAAWSLDVKRRPGLARSSVPAFQLSLLRAQVAIVYLFAGLAKLQPDWLLYAQPLNIWLNARSDFPLLGAWFGAPWMAHGMSWAGFLFDTSIPLWLSLRRTRGLAYAALIGFHCMTRALFPIGMFPVIMVLSALVFFPADWPRRLAARIASALPLGGRVLAPIALPPAPSADRARGWLLRAGLAAACVHVAVQALLPLRHHVYGGNVLWHEQGMRFAWKVMVRAKSGSVTYVAHSPSAGRTFHVAPARYLTSFQEREMSGQPDLIAQLARRIAADLRARGYADVEVRADVVASLNGRRPARLIDPDVDLSRTADGLSRAAYVLPGPSEEPPELRRRRAPLAAKAQPIASWSAGP
jgi:vitamin K-dependent gamma-carboxylase